MKERKHFIYFVNKRAFYLLLFNKQFNNEFVKYLIITKEKYNDERKLFQKQRKERNIITRLDKIVTFG